MLVMLSMLLTLTKLPCAPLYVYLLQAWLTYNLQLTNLHTPYACPSPSLPLYVLCPTGLAVLTYNLQGETPEETTIVGTTGRHYIHTCHCHSWSLVMLHIRF